MTKCSCSIVGDYIERMAGYSPCIFVGTIDEKYLCQKCEKVLKDAVQTYCGRRFCQPCIEGILSQCTSDDGSVICEACDREGITCRISNDKINHDRAIRRELKSLEVRCINKGCNWTGIFRDFERDHYPSCPFEVISCINRNGCTQLIQRGHLADHLENECDMRLTKCSYCHDDVIYSNTEAHFGYCPNVPVDCQFCTKKLERERIAEHTDPDTGDCESKLVNCEFKGAGCNELVPQKMLREHNRRNLGDHLLMLLQTLIPFLTMVQNMEHHKEEINTLQSTLADHHEAIAKLEVIGQALQDKLSVIGSKARSDSDQSTSNSKEHNTLFQILQDTIGKLKNSLVVLETKIVTTEGVTTVIGNQVEAATETVKSLTHKSDDAKELIKSLKRKVEAQDRIIATKDVILAEQDLRIQALEMASFDGVLMWKIANFSRKRKDATSGRTTSIYSPCFYTGRHGYKMCARIYLNGDGMGKGNHVSLFFVVMKGEFDALLRWPFRQKVILMWLDQNKREDVVDAFRPDPTSNSFQRPKNDLNIASGCPLFMPLTALDNPRHAYVKDDAAFIKICIDVSDLN